MPQSPEDYIHRIGRTGRAGRRGEAISLVAVDEDAMLQAIEKLMKHKIPKESFEGYERKVVHVKMQAKFDDKPKKSVKGAFGKKAAKGPAKSKKTTKRDFRYGTAPDAGKKR